MVFSELHEVVPSPEGKKPRREPTKRPAKRRVKIWGSKYEVSIEPTLRALQYRRHRCRRTISILLEDILEEALRRRGMTAADL